MSQIVVHGNQGPCSDSPGHLRQLDVRVSKRLQIGRYRVQGNFDSYNALNASSILSINTRYGASWRQPTEILAARTFKLGATFSF